MKSRILFLLKYYIFWIIYFLTVKLFFILYNYSYLKELALSDIPRIFWYGFRLDLSAATYVLILPFIFILTSVWLKIPFFNKIIKLYTYLLLIVFSLLVVIDVELYKYWSFRLDSTPLKYLSTPQAMLASIDGWIIARQIIILTLIIFVFGWFFRKLIIKTKQEFKESFQLPNFIILLLLFVSLIIPIRGGIGLAPLNTGSAYFSSSSFANHSAINVVWNFGFSLTQAGTHNNPYRIMDEERLMKYMDFYQNTDKQASEYLLKNSNKPNILFIILESFTAKVIPVLGGIDSIIVTPCFNKLIEEGILFNQIYCSGTRSDKGLISIMNGYPAFPNLLVMSFPDKTEKIPSIAKEFKIKGYNTAYYYGGDIDFVSMRSWVKNSGFDKIVSMADFPSFTYNAKWGVHDHVVFQRLLNDLDTTSEPFFYTFFTLSSHEPFDIPINTKIKGDTDDQKFLNSIYYTDSCLGDFVKKAKTSSWWKNTLIILVADHGVLRLGVKEAFDPKRFHIPMLWIGGIVNKNTIISSLGSQMDIAQTLFSQLKFSTHREFPYSRNLISYNAPNYVVSTFNSGILVITPKNKVAFDYTDMRIKFQQGENIENDLEIGKAFLQHTYDDFLKLK